MTQDSRFAIYVTVRPTEPDRLLAHHGRPGESYEDVLKNVVLQHLTASPHNEVFEVGAAEIYNWDGVLPS